MFLNQNLVMIKLNAIFLYITYKLFSKKYKISLSQINRCFVLLFNYTHFVLDNSK